MSDKILSANHFLVAVKSEASYGEDAFNGQTPSEFLAFSEFDFTPAVELVEDDRVRSDHSGRAHDVYESSASVSWAIPVTGIVDPDGTPSFPLGALLKASNFEETVKADPSYSYSLVTGCNQDRVPSATFVHYLLEQCGTEGRKFTFRGQRGNTTLTLEMGQPARLSGDFVGLYEGFPTSTVTTPSVASYAAGEGNRFIVVGMNVTIDNESYAIESFEVSTGWTVVEDRDATTAGSTLAGVYLTRDAGSRVEGSTTLKGRSKTLNTILPAIQSGASMAFEAQLENKAGDVMTITAPYVQIGNAGINKDGHVKFDLPLYLNGSGAGENEIVIEISRK